MMLGRSRSMQGYGRVDENLDEYEDDVEDQYGDLGSDQYEDEEDEEEEEEKEDEPLSEEALKILDFRQKLKEKARSKLRKENGAVSSNSQDTRRASRLENFGSFFGPSKPVLADRVIQESKSLLETRHLAPKPSTSQNDGKKVIAPSSSGTKNGVSTKPRPAEVKSKVHLIKQTRDYSFLLSDDADVPKPAGDPRSQKNLAPKPDARSAQVSAKSNEPSAHSGRKPLNGYEHRKSFGTPQPRSGQTAPPQKLISGNRANFAASDSKRQQDLRKQPQSNRQPGSSNGNGPVRPSVPKVLPPKQPLSSKQPGSSNGSNGSDRKAPVKSIERKASATSVGNKPSAVAKYPTPTSQRPPLAKPQPSGLSNKLDHKRDIQRSTDGKISRDKLAASKSQSSKQVPVRASVEKDQYIKRQKPAGRFSVDKRSNPANKDPYNKKRRAEEAFPDEEVDYRSMIRNMFGYRPNRYEEEDEDDDDMCMEVGFDTIQKEEMRSARIARKEDEEELAKIMEEERQERLRKKAKMRKMSQR